MKTISIFTLLLLILAMGACSENGGDFEIRVEIPDFNFPKTINFEDSLAAYGIFQGSPKDLIPSSDFHLFELSSILFTDYAHKQRLIKVPNGTQMTRLNDGSVHFPNGTILVKTFYYHHDERDPSLGKIIIETRLLIKENDTWNVATYLWNQDQTAATLALNGFETQVSWTTRNGNRLSTRYHVPSENECMACHQSNSSLTPLGPDLRNLNRTVDRNEASLNQISHFQSIGLLSHFPLDQVPQIVNYNSLDATLADRGRAYLAMNCAHCHNPSAWEAPTEREFDFRYETPLDQTGIKFEEDKIIKALSDREMPLIGTTILDQKGVNLVIEYLESL